MARNQKPQNDVYSPYEVVKVPPGQTVKFVSLSREWEGVETHWYGNHSVKCPGFKTCDLCKQRIAQVWKGYLLGCPFGGGVAAIFQITPLAARTLETLIDSTSGLLGAMIKMKRAGSRANSPLEASIVGFDRSIQEIPYESLERTINVLYRNYENLQKPLFNE